MPQLISFAPLITALTSLIGAGTGIYSAVKSSGGGGEAGSPISLPGTSARVGISPENAAAAGLMRPSLFGTTVPSFKGNLEGTSTGPMAGMGSLTDKPLGGQADEFAGILDRLGGGGIG